METCGVFLLLCFSFSIWSETWGQQLQPNCPKYVEEGQDLACECIYRTSTPPAITPIFSWVGQSNTTDLRKQDVSRADNGTIFTCEMRMGSQISYVNYTLEVVYGPSDSNVIIQPRHPILVNGTNPVTLTCVATEVNPRPTFTWIGLTCVKGQDKETCTFTPTLPGDEGRNVTCRVYNYFVSTGTDTATNTLTLRFSSAPSSPATTATTTTSVTTTERATATITTKTSPSSGATSSRSTTLPSSVTTHTTQSGSLSTQPGTTDDVSTTTDDVSTTTDDGREDVDGAQFPLAGFIGGLSGVFVLILIIIIVVVVCRRKKERDISLVRSGDSVDGSYKNSATEDFYSYDNNGYNGDGMLKSHHNHHHHHHHHPSSLSKNPRHMDMERALEIYQSVPTLPVSSSSSSNNNNNNNNTSADEAPEVVLEDSSGQHQDPELGDGTPRQDWEDARRSEMVVRFENPSYSPAPTSSSPGTMADPAAGTPREGGEVGTSPETGTQAEAGTTPPEVRTPPRVGTPPDTDTPADAAGTLPETRRNLDWGAFQPAEEEEETLADAGTPLDWGTQPDTGGSPTDPTTTTSDVYAQVNKPTPSTQMETASPEPGLNPTGVGSEDDTYPPQSDSPQQVEVSSDRSSTIITLTNNHNVPEDGYSH